ncbi:UDP-N-acetylmuramoyl-tripeptide--D-alanyl-D-alanine ligase [Clostridium sp. cel8]|uniref:UDP-N-acetylmuramoyl-tripeptide--D-alanyl-D- alanine ligase n=1 Tax=Clostridium sp. cel8 TaxID=2663123 RepID=UPI0015F511C7|nr:UDP-N-acetylmuramoyl-tripeptide--D-alanyl-D-alanine ligase [Clostridium sp. cel8]MBA5850657.1 UDP-N-acetylmuramoyl-tripeptide--D-alanyl-D-alanine ligase [Clostridium sp. cel8]
MEYMSFEEIVNAVNGKVILKGIYNGFNKVNSDTREIEEKDIFIALKGEKFNGNNYVKQASEKGASICIVDEVKYVESEIKNTTTIIQVENTRKALLDLAEFYRSILDLKVIGITGSVGKTSTKDLVAAALSSKFKVFKTEGNFNNEIGLPKMIFKLDNSYDIAVLEMGMNGLGEIHNMAKAARPDIAIITNVGTAHIGKLKSRENILKAKMEITDFFSEKNTLIINIDNDMLSKVTSDSYKIRKVSIKEKSNISAFNIKLMEDSVEFYIKENNRITEEKITAQVPGKHSVLNCLFAVMAGRIFNMSYDEIRRGLLNLKTTKMRLETIKGKRFTIINDSYNANPDSMIAAIDVLANLKGKKKIAILGTMNELGENSGEFHRKVGRYACEKNVDFLVALGKYTEDYKAGFESFHTSKNRGKVLTFKDYDSAVDFLLKNCLSKGDVVLVKASRSMKFEDIVSKLKESINN